LTQYASMPLFPNSCAQAAGRRRGGNSARIVETRRVRSALEFRRRVYAAMRAPRNGIYMPRLASGCAAVQLRLVVMKSIHTSARDKGHA
jgi:hypothetical protein